MSTNWFPQLAIPGLTCQTIRPHRKDATPSKHESVQGRSRTAQTQHHHRLGDPSGFVAAILKAALYDGKYEVLKGNSQTEPQKPAVRHIRHLERSNARVISFCGQRTQRHIAANDESPTGRKCDISGQGICLWAGDATDSLVCRASLRSRRQVQART
jgi:hypothetical protein